MYQQVFKLHANLLKSISHPKRLEIIQLLRDKEFSVSEIQSMLGLPQANLSQHLQILRDAGVLSTKKQGKNIFYSLSHPNILKASDLLRQFLVQKHQNTPLAKELSLDITKLLPIVTDPICGMRLSPKEVATTCKHNQQSYYFCGQGCQKIFIKQLKNHEKNPD